MEAQTGKVWSSESGAARGARAELSVVTGAFSYTGKYITRRLLSTGKRIRTLTAHPSRPNEFGKQVEIAPLDFDNPRTLCESLSGATTLFNTYWIRFNHGRTTFERAVENSKTLIQAAEDAGVRRIVHVSITNPSLNSPLPYFTGKAEVETAIAASSLSYAILRPTVIFGAEDILINNIAWLLKRAPLFAIPGSGDYRLQPVFVEDVAELAVDVARREANLILDAAGPDVFTFEELVRLIADAVQSRARILHVGPGIALILARLLGWARRDVMLTRDEVDGLMANLLVSAQPPTGRTRFSTWLKENAYQIGTRYVSELARHYRAPSG